MDRDLREFVNDVRLRLGINSEIRLHRIVEGGGTLVVPVVMEPEAWINRYAKGDK